MEMASGRLYFFQRTIARRYKHRRKLPHDRIKVGGLRAMERDKNACEQVGKVRRHAGEEVLTELRHGGADSGGNASGRRSWGCAFRIDGVAVDSVRGDPHGEFGGSTREMIVNAAGVQSRRLASTCEGPKGVSTTALRKCRVFF